MRNYFWTQISPSRSSSDSSSLSSSPDGHTFPTSPPSHHPYSQQSRYTSEAESRHAQSSSSSRPTSHHRAHSYAVAHAPNGHAMYDRRDGYPEPTYPSPSAHGYTGPPGQGPKSAYTTYASPTQQGFPTEQDYAYPGTEASVSSHGSRHTSMFSDSRARHDPRVEALHQTQRGYAVAPGSGRYQTHLDAPSQQYDDGSRRRSRERYA
ncbi:hypothetical protein EWM64_g4305 [Hericium alpestre]|uniref:Uncharacterized protein n=1 Tax=Hericium alpestre TaxID=135208 RepID=A0A4Z0A1K7_9AGAM|nr:hypothetical protein EWM64_g4305 [Hericium alpestre]